MTALAIAVMRLVSGPARINGPASGIRDSVSPASTAIVNQSAKRRRSWR
jgi:hypothetical protein